MPAKINHGVTLYKNNGSTTIKDTTNSPTQCALKPLIGGECAKDSTDTKYTSYRIRKGEDKFNTIISCSNHNVCDDGANFNETFAKLTQIARKAKPEEGFPGVGASAMFNGNTTSQVEKNSYAKKSGGISLVPRTQKEIEESDSEEDVVLFKGRDTASTVSNNTTIKSSKTSSPSLVDIMSAVSIKDINDANSVYSNCNIAPSESASSVDTRNKRRSSKNTSNASSKLGRINRASFSPSITTTNSRNVPCQALSSTNSNSTLAKSNASGFSVPLSKTSKAATSTTTNSLIGGFGNGSSIITPSLLDSGDISTLLAHNATRRSKRQARDNNGQNGNANRISVTINVGSDLTK